MNSAIAPPQCSQEEWALRTKLTQCYHLVDHFGWTETIFNHISARLPGKEHHYLVNPFGLNYTEITPENLLKVDLDGNKVEQSEYDANPAGFALHSAVHGARDDIRCMIHTHTTPISAVVQKSTASNMIVSMAHSSMVELDIILLRESRCLKMKNHA
ncbi:class II aldolase/adducin family protein [Acinetobacter soli]|nr:class II aldolase/adducin family protein [Acinetobacter soli]WEI10783.1 class II aldolase/adducin family protein [Acinetobacter soli]